MSSKSRKVNGYVKTWMKLRVLTARLAAKQEAFEASTAKLRREITAHEAGLIERFATLTGAQIAEARRLTANGGK